MPAPCEEIRPELEALLGAMTDGALDEAGRRRLSEILRGHPEARQLYFDYCQMHALLTAAHGTLQAMAEPGRSRRPRILALAAAAGLLAAAGLALWGGARPAALLDARIVPEAGSAWIVDREGRRTPVAEARGIRDGDRFVTGPGARSEIRTGDGSRLVLLERTEAEVRKGDGAGRVGLREGTLRCEVTPRSGGGALVFSTPHAEATVLGTSFELSADAGETRLRTTAGRVRLAAAGRSVEVGPGEAGSADERGPVRWTPVCSLDFAGRTELPKTLEMFFCPSEVLLTPARKIEPAPSQARFVPEGLVLVPRGSAPHGLVEARWKEEVGEDVILEADVARGEPWTLGLSVSGHAFEGYRIIVAAVQGYPNGVAVDTIHPAECLVLAKDPRPITWDEEHTLRVERRGRRIRVWVDRELRIDTEVDHPLPEARKRTFSITNFGSPPVLRRLRAWKIESP